jgi:Leucine-rich repeat (LRR) protein
LENLTVTKTEIKKIEKFYGNLTTLKLTKNKIQEISGIEIESLEVLDLSHNKIEKIPEIFKNFSNLREVSLDFNQIEILEWKIFKENSKLEMISIKGNKLSQIGSNLEIIGSIREVLSGEWDEIWRIEENKTEETTLEPIEGSESGEKFF